MAKRHTFNSFTTLTSNSFASQVKAIYNQSVSLTELMDIIAFCESSSGLAIKLHPAQRVVLKLFYGLKLDNDISHRPIVIRDELNRHILHTFNSEIEFVDFLHSQQKINISSQQYAEVVEGTGMSEVVFICGRRASKTTMTSIISCYILYILLSIKNPHDYFGVLRSDPIGVALVSNNLEGATRTYSAVTDLVTNSKFFQNYIGGELNDTLWLRSESYMAEEQDGIRHSNPGNIMITSYAANANVRGASNIVVVIDEIAHFMDADTRKPKDKHMDEVVYEALYPSILGFVDPHTNKGVGKSFIMSSPNGKKGLLYHMYQKSFERPTTLMINTPSHWINPRIASQELEKIRSESENSFRQEILAEFVDKESNWLTDINRLYACFNHAQTNECQQHHNYTCFAGFDLGLSNDNSVLAIGHFQEHRPEHITLDKPEYEAFLAQDRFYVIDYVHIWSPKEDGTPINPEVIISDLAHIFRRFKVKMGTYDQFSHALFTSMLNKSPHITLRMEPATRKSNSQRAVLTKRIISEGRLLIPNIELVRNEWSSLQEEVFAEGEVRVANDLGHDDTYSAISRCIEQIYLNTEIKNNSIIGRPHISGGLNFNPRKLSNNFVRNSMLSQRVMK